MFKLKLNSTAHTKKGLTVNAVNYLWLVCDLLLHSRAS
jgi:hypothetical protein